MVFLVKKETKLLIIRFFKGRNKTKKKLSLNIIQSLLSGYYWV